MKLPAFLLSFVLLSLVAHAQDSLRVQRKNIIRYNLSGALLFGPDKYIVLGYERALGKHQSISVNFGTTALPQMTSITTDSFSLKKDVKNAGYNFSVDYRFYPSKE